MAFWRLDENWLLPVKSALVPLVVPMWIHFKKPGRDDMFAARPGLPKRLALALQQLQQRLRSRIGLGHSRNRGLLQHLRFG